MTKKMEGIFACAGIEFHHDRMIFQSDLQTVKRTKDKMSSSAVLVYLKHMDMEMHICEYFSGQHDA